MTYSKFNLLVIALTALCALVLGSFNYVVDPFNKNRSFDLELPKSEVSKRMHYPLFKTIAFQNEPRGTLLLGDSRTGALNVSLFEQLGDSDVFNMAYGGGTVYEIIDSFWFAVNLKNLKRVYIGLPFSVYNTANKTNRFSEAKPMIDGSFAYYFSPFVAKTGFYNVASRLKGKSVKTERPDMNKEQFWKSQLGDLTTAAYGSWQTSNVLDDQLRSIAVYCKDNSIELTFFNPPTHVDLQQKIVEFKLEQDYESYLSTLSGMARLIDFDFANELTKDKSKFKDPYHFTSDVGPFVARALLGLPLPAHEQRFVREVNAQR